MNNGKLIKANLDREFFAMRNHAFRNKTLSYKAMGLLAFMLQTPPGWEFSVSGLQSCAKDGRDSIRAGLHELQNHKYFFRIAYKDQKGKYVNIEYHISDIPFPDNYLKTTFPDSKFKIERGMLVCSYVGKPENGTPVVGQSTQYNINLINDLSNTLKKENSEFEIVVDQASHEIREGIIQETGEGMSEELPPQERMIQKALLKAKAFFEKWPAMIQTLPEQARIRPDDTSFDFWAELENYIRHNGDNLSLMSNPERYIPSKFGRWLQNYHTFKPKSNNHERNTGRRKNKHLISEEDARDILSDLNQNGI